VGGVLANNIQVPWLVEDLLMYNGMLTNQGSWLLLPRATPGTQSAHVGKLTLGGTFPGSSQHMP
jgi:hypothetical protein